MRNYLIAGIITLFSGTAFAGIPASSQPGASSTGVDAGEDASLDDLTVKTITSTGTAPSLTATGAEFGSSITVRTAGGQSAALFSTATDDGQLRLCNRTRGPLCTFGGNGVYQFLVGNGGLFSIYGEGETFFSYNYPNVYFNGAGARVGIGTASPASKLDVVGDAQFGSGVNKATVTAGGFWQPLAQTTLQASLLAPTSLGQYIQNSTINELCKSTGTSAGNWQKVDGGGGCF